MANSEEPEAVYIIRLMYINLFLIPYIIILGLIMGTHDTQKTRKRYIITCSAVLLFVAAMRSPEYMTNTYSIDTLNYKDMFENAFDMGWEEFFEAFYMRYFGGGAEEADIGFVSLNKIIGYFTHDFAIFSLLADLLFFIPFGIILYRYSTNIYGIIFAFVYYVSLIQVFLIGGARQIFSIGLDMMALLAVLDRKKLRAIIFFLLGLTIHASSFLFLAPLLMVWYGLNAKILKLLHLICFIVFPIVLMMPNQIIAFMGEAAGSEKYAEYGRRAVQGGANVFLYLMELLSLFCLIAIKKKNMLQNKSMAIFYVMLPFLTLFTPLIKSNGTMIRIALYYSIFMTLLVPYSIECLFKKNNKFGYAAAIGVLSLLALIGGGMRYYFYWQV